ncbi:hypothetical protein GBAR_LOCUS27229, partial [Geodia barretti]
TSTLSVLVVLQTALDWLSGRLGDNGWSYPASGAVCPSTALCGCVTGSSECTRWQ